tara:strand:- start:1800 stop:3005 length:1206 start_codon:yes stop_codon:yes gene_type:complete
MTRALLKQGIKLLAGVVVLALLAFAFWPRPLPVDMAQVTRGDVVIGLDGEGKTRIRDIYVVSAPIDGRVTRVEIDPGDQVRSGVTVIANMSPADPDFLDQRTEQEARAEVQAAEAALALARAQVKKAEADLELARSDYVRTKVLYQRGNVSDAALERAQADLRSKEAELEKAISDRRLNEGRLAAAQARLVQPGTPPPAEQAACQVCVRAPVDGRVLRLYHENEGVIARGTPLVEIGDPRDLEIVIELLSTDAVRVQPGDAALIRRWGGGEDLKAVVRRVEPSGFTKISALGVEEQRVNVILDFTDPVEKWASLGDAYRVEATIIVDRAENVVQVPLSALFRQEEGWAVFAVEGGRAILRPVTVGRRNDRQAEILTGLAAGETIILHPGNDVVDGIRVVSR